MVGRSICCVIEPASIEGMNIRITYEQLGRLQAALNIRVQRLESFRPLLHLTDPAMMETGL